MKKLSVGICVFLIIVMITTCSIFQLPTKDEFNRIVSSIEGDNGDTTPAGEVSGLTAAPGDGSVVLSWTAPDDEDFDGSATTLFSGNVEPDGAAVEDLTNGIEYTFIVKTVDESGNVSEGISIAEIPSDGIYHHEVNEFSATTGTDQVTLTWTKSEDENFDFCEVWYGRGSESSTKFSGTIDHSGTVITGLKDSIYTFEIKAVNKRGETSSGVSRKVSMQFGLDSDTLCVLHLDEGAGTTAADSTPNNFDGSIQNCSWYSNGIFDDTLFFDGDSWSWSSRITIPDNEQLEFVNDFTVEAWIMLSDPPNHPSGRYVIRKYDQSSTDGTFQLSVQSDSHLNFQVRNGEDKAAVVSDNALNPDVWYHVGGCFKDGELKLILNGDAIKTGTAPFTSCTDSEYSNDEITIGGYWTSGSYWLYGYIDEVRLSNRARY